MGFIVEGIPRNHSNASLIMKGDALQYFISNEYNFIPRTLKLASEVFSRLSDWIVMNDNFQTNTMICAYYDCTYQHFIINLYTCLGQPGGGSNLYPCSTFWRAYVCERDHWFWTNCVTYPCHSIRFTKPTSLFVQSWNGLMPMAQISYSKTP